ncbi:3-deoxy-D-manno-octulosonic acid kinase [Vibrio penaeicida]|uniref:3-deoxy-D-manno-octulosonic acid kinase n=1 Tax=Vibrio penaeicida TaxID=104609 RepID=A0AAV5NV88_9VIBR|nr:3-deoxy-D-manno-octulosonic acid kinase [Vibrio penaeicida]RTZ22219.1 3-deoxy-D-manno-octulosonic acid kinase [Vibrio penaeicida]GLQ74616.1 3-deoxy-D-manno-octulosonic acid kinase [Vibrio penaeicida]
MIKTHCSKNQKIWYDSNVIHHDLDRLFDIDYWQNQNKVIGQASGRGTTWFVDLGETHAALRHYRRGGLFGKLVKDQYVFTGFDKTRSALEFSLLGLMRKNGLNVPKPIAANAQKTGLTYRADIITEKIKNARDLVDILKSETLEARHYQQIGREIRKMHDLGINHTDLNIHNILMDEQEKFWIIDFDKCFQQSGESWKQGNLERLKRSFEKEAQRSLGEDIIESMEPIIVGYREHDK